MKNTIIVFVLLSICSSPAIAWEGYDQQTGNPVEIDSGNLVRRGETIDVFDMNDGKYHMVDVDNISRFGGSVNVEGYDWEKGEYRTFEMDGNNH